MLILHRGLCVSMARHFHQRSQIAGALKSIRRECVPTVIRLHGLIESALPTRLPPLIRYRGLYLVGVIGGTRGIFRSDDFARS